MSVLIESLTLVIRRRCFDSTFPGGADTLLAALTAAQPSPRYACADDPHLLAISYDHSDHAAHAISLLRTAGLKSPDDTLPDLSDFILVDAHSGPATRIAWLGFNTHEDGFSFAWDIDEPIGAIAGPPEWMRQHRENTDHGFVGDDSDQLVLLSSENGIRTYLDLRTGALTESTAAQIHPPARPGGPNADGRFGIDFNAPSEDPILRGRLHHLLAIALSELGWNMLIGGPSFFVAQCKGKSTVYSCKFIVAEESNAISCSVLAPMEITVKHRRRVLEYVSRLNWDMALGGFDLNLDNGALFFRASIALGDQDPTPAMVAEIARVGIAMMDRYFSRVLEIGVGLRTVAEAVTTPLE